MEVFHNLFFSGFFFVTGYAKFFVTGCSLFYKKCLTLKWYRMVPFCEGVGKGPNLVKKRKIMEKMFSISRKMTGLLLVLSVVATIDLGYSTDTKITNWLMWELMYGGSCYFILLAIEWFWGDCDCFDDYLAAGLITIAACGAIIVVLACLLEAIWWFKIGLWLAGVGLGLNVLNVLGSLISFRISG